MPPFHVTEAAAAAADAVDAVVDIAVVDTAAPVDAEVAAGTIHHHLVDSPSLHYRYYCHCY